MPLYNREEIYSVPISMKGGATLTYVFGSKQDMSGLTADLGITAIADPSAIPATGVFTGASSPKPPRASQVVGTKRKSSFCDAAVASTKKEDGVRIQYPKNTARAIHTIDDAALVVSVFVELDGIKRAWNMAKAQYALISADFTELGIEPCTDADIAEYVWGCEAPYPAKVKRVNATGVQGGDVYTTFCSEAKENNLEKWVKVANRITVARYFGAPDVTNMAP